jgi:hypothetical protein
MPKRQPPRPADETADGDALVAMARLALAGHRADIIAYTRRQSYRLRTRSPQTAAALDALLADEPAPSLLRASQTGGT